VQFVPFFVAFGVHRCRLHRLHSGQARDAEHRAASTSGTAMLRIPAATNPPSGRREVRERMMGVMGDSHCPGIVLQRGQSVTTPSGRDIDADSRPVTPSLHQGRATVGQDVTLRHLRYRSTA
jgi:hypothetical protein